MMPANRVGDVDDAVEEGDDPMSEITNLSDCD